jgi:hypothetical protein
VETFNIPEDITALDDAALAAAIAAAVEASSEFAETEPADLTDEQIDSIEALASFVGNARQAQTERAEAAAARAERVQSARAALAPTEEPPAEEAPVEEAPAEEAPAVTAAAPKAKASVINRVAKVAPKVETEPARPRASLTASADVPGFALGQDLDDLDQVVQAFQARLAGLPTTRLGGEKGIHQRFGTAKITKARTDDLVVNERAEAQAVFDRASRESRLSGGTLVAAGGWCAPSETLYDLCTVETTEGLLDMPEVQVNRGGIRYTQGPDLSAVFADLNSIGFIQTEAQAEAGDEKTCEVIECPDFIDVRLDAIGICIKAGILTNVGYPELVRRYIEGLLIAHQHKISANLIGRIQTLIGPAQTLADVWANAAPSVLSAVELVLEGYRQQHRMSFTQTVEILLPHWILPALRADLANTWGIDNLSVTDQMIRGWFALRGASPQFLYNYQPLTIAAGTGTGGQGIATDYPDTLEFMMYPAGSYVKGTTDVINLDSVYDSVGLSTNTYTALFAEEGVLVAEMCTKGRRVSIPLAVTGNRAANHLVQDFGSAPTVWPAAAA